MPLYLFIKNLIFKAAQDFKSERKLQAQEFNAYFPNKSISLNYFTRCDHYSICFLFVINICSFFSFSIYNLFYFHL